MTDGGTIALTAAFWRFCYSDWSKPISRMLSFRLRIVNLIDELHTFQFEISAKLFIRNKKQQRRAIFSWKEPFSEIICGTSFYVDFLSNIFYFLPLYLLSCHFHMEKEEEVGSQFCKRRISTKENYSVQKWNKLKVQVFNG